MIKNQKICSGSFLRCSLRVMTLLIFLTAWSGYAQKKAAEPVLNSAQKNLILDQRLSYKEREQKIDELVREGDGLEMKQDFDMAVDKYLAAKKLADEIVNVQSFKTRSDNCASKIANAYFYWAQNIYNDAVKSANEQDYDSAIDKCRKAIEIYPACKEKMEKIIERYTLMKNGAQYERKINEVKPSDEELRVKRVLLRQGQVLYDTKQWDKARSKFEEVIVLDPYNETAIDYIRRINIHLQQASRLHACGSELSVMHAMPLPYGKWLHL